MRTSRRTAVPAAEQPAVNEASDHHRRALAALHHGVAVIDTAGSILYLNPAGSRLLGRDLLESRELKLADLLVLPQNAEKDREEKLPRPLQEAISVQRLLTTASGRPVPVLLSVAPISEEDGSAQQWVCSIHSAAGVRNDRRWLATQQEPAVPLSLPSLTQEIIDYHQDTANGAEVAIELDASPSLPSWVRGPRSSIQSILHALIEAGLQWTENCKLRMVVNAVVSPVTRKAVVRFRLESSEGELDEQKLRSSFDGDVEDSLSPDDGPPNLRGAIALARSLGGDLGLHRETNGCFVARLWLELALDHE